MVALLHSGRWPGFVHELTSIQTLDDPSPGHLAGAFSFWAVDGGKTMSATVTRAIRQVVAGRSLGGGRHKPREEQKQEDINEKRKHDSEPEWRKVFWGTYSIGR